MKLKVLNVLAETYIAARLCDSVPEVRMGLLEHDGRKQGRVAKELAEEGLVELKSSEAHYTAQRLIVTPKCMEFFEAKKPNLLREVEKCNNEYDLCQSHNSDLLRFGLRWSALTIEERKYVLEHRDDYEVVLVKDMYRRGDAQVVSATELKAGDFRFVMDGLFIRDAHFVRGVAEKTKTLRFDRLFKTNLPWGLVTLLGISEEASRYFRAASEDSMAFLSSGPSGMGNDPEKWGADLEKMETSVQEQILDMEKRRAAIAHVQHLLKDKFGGMAGFLAAYRARLQEEIDKQEETKPEEEAKKDACGNETPVRVDELFRAGG